MSVLRSSCSHGVCNPGIAEALNCIACSHHAASLQMLKHRDLDRHVQVKDGKWVPGRAVQYFEVAGHLVGKWAGAFTLLITVISLISTSAPLIPVSANSRPVS